MRAWRRLACLCRRGLGIESRDGRGAGRGLSRWLWREGGGGLRNGLPPCEGGVQRERG